MHRARLLAMPADNRNNIRAENANSKRDHNVGSDHVHISNLTSEPLHWDIRCSLYTTPMIVGTALLLLIILSCSLVIAGLIGAIDPVLYGLVVTGLGVLISILETIFVAIGLRTSKRRSIAEYYIKRKRMEREQELSNRAGTELEVTDDTWVTRLPPADETNDDTEQLIDTSQDEQQRQTRCSCCNKAAMYKFIKERIETNLEGLELTIDDRDGNLASLEEEFGDFERHAIFPELKNFRVLTFLGHSIGFRIFCGLMFFNASFILSYWGLAMTVIDFNPPVWYAYLMVDMLIGVASPVSLCVSIIILGQVGRTLTNKKLRVETIIPALLTFVKYIKESKESKYPYWKVVDYFQFPIYPSPLLKVLSPYKTCIMFLKNLPFNISSMCLMGMVFVTFCLSVTYIVGQLLTAEQFVFSCGEVKEGFECFEHASKEYVNCSTFDPSERTELDCFRFNQVGVQSDPIGTIITALFLYLACDKFLTVMFKFIKEFYKIHPGKVWGTGVSLFGLLLLMMSCSCVIIYDQVHSVYFDFQKLLQLFIISMNIFLSGVLLFTVQHVKPHTDKNKQQLSNVNEAVQTTTATNEAVQTATSDETVQQPATSDGMVQPPATDETTYNN